MHSNFFRFNGILLLICMGLFAACDDSGSTVPDGDTESIRDICDECRSYEKCIEAGGSAICAAPCDSNDDCGDEICCYYDETSGYCLPKEMCEVDITIYCVDDVQCPEGEICDETLEICVEAPATDGDNPPTDGDDQDGDLDGSEDSEQEDLPPDPLLSYNNPCNFGAVPLGAAEPTICTVQICNSGPTKDAAIVYSLDYPATSEEFWIDEELALEEGEYADLKVGDCLDVPILYYPVDPGKDLGSMELIVTAEDDASLRRYYIDLVTEEKGEVHAFTIPEEPNPLDFGPVRLYTPKTQNVIVGHRRLNTEDTITMRAYNFRFDAAEDPNFSYEGEELYLLAPGAELEVPLTCFPLMEGELENTLIFQTNDVHHQEFRIPVSCEGVKPEICTYPFNVDFGEVPFGECGTRTLEICNCGGYELWAEGLEMDDPTLQFSYFPPDLEFPHVMPPEGEGLPGSDCFEVVMDFCPQEMGVQEAFMIINSDAPGDEAYQVRLQGEGVGPELCSFPPTPMDFGRIQFGSSIGGSTTPMNVQIWNCGPGEALVCCLDLMLNAETADGTFVLDNFTPFRPMECDPENINKENCLPLVGGDSPNYLNFQILYTPEEYGSHKAVMHVTARSGYLDVGKDFEIKALASSCPDNYWDLDPLIPGCEYYCEFQDSIDEPDLDFIDANCDGIDGMVDRAIFVASDGNDRNDGTYANPKRNIQSAIFSALQDFSKTDVYIAAGNYNERLMITSGVSIYGGYSRHTTDSDSPIGWKRGFDYESTTFGDHFGMIADGIGRRTKVQLLTVQADNGIEDSVSSYGIYSRRADALTLEAVTVYAGDGLEGTRGFMQGQDGEDGDSGERGQSGREDDSSWYCNGQGRPGVGLGGYSTCGQRGGNGGYSCKTGGSSCAGFEGEAGSCGAAGGPGHNGGQGSSGRPGDNGYNGSHGDGGTWEGAVNGGKWAPNAGQSGTPGGHGCGGGGGGGGGSNHSDMLLIETCEDWGGTGGGGGGGGCGGGGGSGGLGGGSSFGIFLFDSRPEIIDCVVYAGEGGIGGDGRVGGRGGFGGDGGQGGTAYDEGDYGGPGGAGGSGGTGGAGGGGAGGSSIGIYCAGSSQPIIESTDVYPGDFGFGGDPGTWAGNPGEDGRSMESYNCPQ